MSDQTVAKYNFLSYARRGAAADLTNVDPLTGPIDYRGPLTVTLALDSSDNGNTQRDILTQTVLLRGPGDVIGVDERRGSQVLEVRNAEDESAELEETDLG